MAAEELENLQEKMNWHWRNSMMVVRFFTFDARAAATLPLLLVYFRTSTLILTFLVLVAFRIMENRGLTVPAAMRSLRSWITGSDRYGVTSMQRRRFIDFG